MTNYSHRLLLLLTSIFVTCMAADSLPNSDVPIGQHALSIPIYPGTKLFGYDHSILNMPFATIMRVYKTRDGDSLDSEKVIAFYKDYYMRRGWEDAVFRPREKEPYLGLSAAVYEQGGSYSNIQVDVGFYLWLAPNDGMLTMYMRQWRTSSLTQAATSLYGKTESKLNAISKEINYTLKRIHSYGGWQEYYENEYLVEFKAFALRNAEQEAKRQPSHADALNVFILAYKNPEVAAIQAEIFGRKVPHELGPVKTVAQIENILVLFENGDIAKNLVVADLVEKLKPGGED